TRWRNAAFSARKTSISRRSAVTRSRISGGRIIHTLTHVSPPHVPKNRAPPGIFTKTVANETHPSLGVTVFGGTGNMQGIFARVQGIPPTSPGATSNLTMLHVGMINKINSLGAMLGIGH